MNIFNRIRKLDFPPDQYAVFGSALLDVWGIRRAKDLDIIVTPELYGRLEKADWQKKRGNGFGYLERDDVSISTIQNRSQRSGRYRYNPDRLKLIKDAVYIEGLPFVRIEEVIACKGAYGRPKDKKDIKLIVKYLRQHPGHIYDVSHS